MNVSVAVGVGVVVAEGVIVGVVVGSEEAVAVTVRLTLPGKAAAGTVGRAVRVGDRVGDGLVTVGV